MFFKRMGNIIFALFIVLGLFTGTSVKPAHADALAISTYGASTNSWNTFLGSASNDSGGSIAVDGEGNMYASGTSYANWGNPIVPYTGSNGHSDGFVAKLDSSGNLLWNTFMGSSDNSKIYGIALDNEGNVYVAGDSSSTWGAPLNGFAGTNDVFIAKFNTADGSRLWNTFLGGTDTDYGNAIAADKNGGIYVTGLSAATWGSPKTAFAGPVGIYDAFAAKLDSNGAFQWNTFMGGNDQDFSYAIALDKTGQYAFVTGDSFATWGTPVNPFVTGSSDDGFVVKLDTSDGTREWNTFFGGSGSVNGLGIVIDGSENSYVSGYSDSTWGTPISEFSGGASDGFIAKLNRNGVLQWNTFLGGTGRDTGFGIALVGDNSLYVDGQSFTSWGNPLNLFHSGKDAFIAQLNTAGNLLWNTFIGGTGDENSYGIAIGGTGDIYILGDSTATWGTPVRSFGGAYDAFVALYPPPTFLISGNAGVAGATVNYTGGSVSADDDGNYSITIPYTWSGAVIPSKAGYTFSPASKSYTNVTSDKPGEDYVASISTNTPWNTFLGGTGNDYSYSIAVDGEGNIYVGGISYTNWGNPIIPYSGGNSYSDGFIAKLDSSGNLLWNTFMGSSTNSAIYGIALDSQDNVYVTGGSSSSWGAPLHGFAGANDVFIAEFNSADGSRLWNTFLGGTDSDTGDGIVVDKNGDLYIAGYSADTWGSPKTAFAGPAGTHDGFTAKLDGNGALQWNTFQGGNGSDFSNAVTIDKTGQYVFIAGDSSDTWGTPVNPFTPGSYDDGFVAKLDASDGNLEWNTFSGGLLDTFGAGIVLDGNGNSYVSGASRATWGTPITPFSGVQDAYIAKLNSSGVLQWNTFIGGTGRDIGYSIALDGNHNLFINGISFASWGNPLNPYHPSEGTFLGEDAFIAELTIDGNLLWNTFIGGAGDDAGGGIVIGENESIYIAGTSNATWGNPVHNFGGAIDVFVASYLQQPTFLISGNAGVAGATVNYTGGLVSSDNNGNYSITIPYNWSGTVTPSKTGYTFSPASKSYTNVTSDKTGEDYVATPNNIRIVTNTNPSGAGSLGDAIYYSVSGDTIIFDPTLAGKTIYFISESVITKSITIDASSLSTPVILNGQGIDRLFQISSGITFELKNIVLKNGYYNGDGGAIDNHGILKLTRTVISDSTAFGWGGGIYNVGELTVVDSTFSNNHSNQANGGAIYTSGTTATATIQNSTFHDNYPYAVYSRSTLNVTNSTFTDNSIAGIYTNGKLTIKNSTIADNGGGAYGIEAYDHYSGGTNTSTLRIENTILANNSGTDCYNRGAIVLSFINNLMETGNCGTPTVWADPKLGALADNGGPTWTMALLAGSPAIDAGDDATCQTVDQRGITRPQGPHCDIGAFENVPIIPPAEYTLTINKVGDGTVNPDKAAPYHLNDVVGLTAVADAGWTFSGWSGACTGTGACSVTMNADKTVTATFTQIPNTMFLISPSGTLTSWDHSFHWTGLSNATWYQLEVQTSSGTPVFSDWYTSAQAGCADGTACVIFPSEAINVANGNYQWRIQDYGDYGYGTWTPFMSFTPPATAVMGVPSGTLTSWDHFFHWTGLSNATDYYLEVQTSAGTPVFDGWYTAAQAGCTTGTACAISSTIAAHLANGDYKWHLMDYGSYGYGNWTPFQNFTLNIPPAAAVLGTPSAALTSWDRAFHWTGFPDSTWYYLEVQSSSGTPLFNAWYTNTQSGCEGGTLCAISPTQALHLANGDYQWRIMDYGGYGYGSWTAFQGFSLNTPPAGGILSDPLGTLTSWDHSFHWTGFPDSTWYYVEVQTSTGTPVFSSWYTASQTGCESGTTCAVLSTEAKNLANGDYKWHLLDYGPYGYGSWSAFQSFTLNIPPAIAVLGEPSGTLTSWDHSFHWTGVSEATWYLLDVQTSDGTEVYNHWLTTTEANCASGTACAVSPTELQSLANGSYKWRILDYGPYGYGNWTTLKDFTLNQ